MDLAMLDTVKIHLFHILSIQLVIVMYMYVEYIVRSYIIVSNKYKISIL